MSRLIISMNHFLGLTLFCLEAKFMNAISRVDLKNIAILMEENGIDDIGIDMLADRPPLNFYIHCKTMSEIRGLQYTVGEIKNMIDIHRISYHNQKLTNTALLTILLACV